MQVLSVGDQFANQDVPILTPGRGSGLRARVAQVGAISPSGTQGDTLEYNATTGLWEPVHNATYIRSLDDLPALSGNFYDLEPGCYILCPQTDLVLPNDTGIRLVDTLGTGLSHKVWGWGPGALAGDPDFSGSTGAKALISRTTDAADVTIDNVTFQSSASSNDQRAIGVVGANPFHVHNCSILSGCNGIWLDDATSYVGVSNTLFTGLTEHGVNAYGSAILDGCVWYSMTAPACIQAMTGTSIIQVTGGLASSINNFFRSGNTNCHIVCTNLAINGATNDGFVLTSGNGVRVVTTGCWINNCGNAAYNFTNLPYSAQIIGNNFDNNSFDFLGFTAATASTFLRGNISSGVKLSETAIVP